MCLSKYIAIIPPIEPPTKDSPRSVTILILDLRSIAAILSMANAAKVTKLIMTKYANSIPLYKKIVGTKRHIVKTNLKTYDWYNKNKLLSTYEYTTGGKTGFTEKARRTLVTSATKDNLNLIVVTLNDPNDFTTHKTLYEYGFNNYKKYLILEKKDFKVENEYYKELYIKNDIYYILKNNEINNISVKYQLKKIYKPKNNEIVGKVIVYLDKKEVSEEDIFVKVKEKTKKKESIFKRILNLFK